VVNRDLSIAVLTHFQEQRSAGQPHEGGRKARGAAARSNRGLHILEGLAASGLRSVRYALELPNVERVVANDLDPSVVESINRNIEFNGPEVIGKVVPSVGDARIVCMQNPGAFDAVDLDPYGSPSQLLDSAVQAVAEGGLLLVTATDMAVLCGNNGEACYAKYGSYPLHRPYCHEMAVRIVLGAVHLAAARHKKYIVPLLSCSIDFYVRVFVMVHTSPSESKNAAIKMGYVYQSQGCDSFYWQRVGRKNIKGNSTKYAPALGPPMPSTTCPETGANFSVGGPYWAEAMHDQDWLKAILALVRCRKSQFASADRLVGLLTSCAEELPDAPLYLDLHDVCKTLKCTAPRAEVFKSALLNGGYRVSGTHCNPLGIKTDAPWNVIWDILRCWVRDHPVKPNPGSNAEKILSKEPEFKPDFSRAPQAMRRDKKGRNKVARFPPNPEAHWGPKSKHSRTIKASQASAEAMGGGNEAQQQQEQQQPHEKDKIEGNGVVGARAQDADRPMDVPEDGATNGDHPGVVEADVDEADGTHAGVVTDDASNDAVKDPATTVR
jgi:tRNA (guanine26-N2/guanine27-N2)-dimethyltransferase